MSKEKSSSKYAVHKTTPVAPQSRTVTATTPTSSPGIAPSKAHKVTAVPKSITTRVVNSGRKD